MWYVIQTISGYETDVKEFLRINGSQNDYHGCFIPLYEEVRRRNGTSKILIRKMFPGYLFLDTENPNVVLQTLRKMKEFTKVLGVENGDGSRTFIPVGAEDQEFLQTLLVDGVMRVSYIEMSANNRRIERVEGPLAKYRNHITSLEVRNREAVVEMDVFGKRRKIRFGLWTKADPKLPRIGVQVGQATENLPGIDVDVDIGIHPGDFVRDKTGIYGEHVFCVESVNPFQRTLKAKIQLFGGMQGIELFAEDVERV